MVTHHLTLYHPNEQITPIGHNFDFKVRRDYNKNLPYAMRLRVGRQFYTIFHKSTDKRNLLNILRELFKLIIPNEFYLFQNNYCTLQ